MKNSFYDFKKLIDDFIIQQELAIEIKLFSLTGSEMLSQDVNHETQKVNFNVSHINNGIYLVKVILNGVEIHAQKLMIILVFNLPYSINNCLKYK